jgi:hypothetical protein
MKKLQGKALTKKLDDTIREILHAMYPNPRCFVCGNNWGWYHPKTNKRGCQIGHYISRRYTQLRWDLDNIQPHCAPCNYNHNYNPAPFTQALIKTYGQERINYLDSKAKEPVPTTPQKREILEELKNKLDKLVVK